MNDFTKKELEDILTCVNAISYNNKESKETLKSSKEKIESMIDNYCEHEWIVKKDKNNSCYPECHKCGTTNDNK